MKEATCVLYNGKILTLDQFNSTASAVAFCGDRILATGTDAQMRALASSESVHLDLQEATVMPGFFDAHGHFLQTVEYRTNFVDINSPPIGDCVRIEDCLKKLKERAEITPKDGWVLGYGFDDTMIAEKSFPTRQDLDEVSTEHYVLLLHISGRFAAVNSKVLDRLQYTKETIDPPAGAIWRDENNEPTGVLEGSVVVGLIGFLPAASSEAYADSLVKLAHEYAEKGVTSAIEAGAGHPRYFHAFLQAEAQGRMFMRLSYNPSIFFGEGGMENYTSPLLRRHGPKLWSDGSIQGFTGYLSEPYHTPYKGDASWRGYPTIPREELISRISEYHKADLQCVIHANGDQAIEDTLDAFELALKEYPVADPRFLLIHAQTIRADQLERCRLLGVTISFFTMHTYYWGDRHKSIFLGPERVERQNPMRWAIDKGIIVTSHCDAPIVPLTPFLSVCTCVNRTSTSGEVLGKEQRISVIEALKAHTLNPAWQNFEEKDKGSIEAGKYADVIILDRDPFTCAAGTLRDIKVNTTFIGGQVVFQR